MLHIFDVWQGGLPCSVLWYWEIRAPTANSPAGLSNSAGWELGIVGVMACFGRVYLYCGSVENMQFPQIINRVVCRKLTHRPGFKQHLNFVW